MPLIVIISTAISTILLFLTVVILIKNNTKIYLKSLLSLSVLFFVLKSIDLLSIFINPASFYSYFGMFFKDFHQLSLIILLSFFFILLINLIRNKGNSRILVSITTFLTLLTYFTFFYLESSLYRIIYIIHCILASIISLRILIFEREKYDDYNIFKFLSFIYSVTIFFMLFITYYLFSINKMFADDMYILETVSNFYGEGYHKLILNVCLISFSLYILLTKKILHGKYYYESKNNIINFKNHWNNVIIRKIEKKDLKLYEHIQTKISKLVLDLNKLERSYINNNVLFSSLEEISQLINQRVVDVEFVFKYNNYLTFKKYMLKINMLKAATLIKNGFLKSNSVTDLSKLFGYSSRSAFFTKFKEINGYSPSQFT